MQDKIKQLFVNGRISRFSVNNGKFECRFKKPINPFGEWRKDTNSPAFFCDAMLDIFDKRDAKEQRLDGMILVHRDDLAIQPFVAFLYVKPLDADKWESMHIITSLEF